MGVYSSLTMNFAMNFLVLRLTNTRFQSLVPVKTMKITFRGFEKRRKAEAFQKSDCQVSELRDEFCYPLVQASFISCLWINI